MFLYWFLKFIWNAHGEYGYVMVVLYLHQRHWQHSSSLIYLAQPHRLQTGLEEAKESRN